MVLERKKLVIKLAECLNACNTCFDACLNDNHVKIMTECIRLCRECSSICCNALVLIHDGSRFNRLVLNICILACQRCADECRKFAHPHCRECAEACDACRQACERYLLCMKNEQAGIKNEESKPA